MQVYDCPDSSHASAVMCVWEELGNPGQHVFNTQTGKISQSAKKKKAKQKNTPHTWAYE